MNERRWVRAVLVGQVEFVEWTPDNHLRHTGFVALQERRDAQGLRTTLALRRDFTAYYRRFSVKVENPTANQGSIAKLVMRSGGVELHAKHSDRSFQRASFPGRRDSAVRPLIPAHPLAYEHVAELRLNAVWR